MWKSHKDNPAAYCPPGRVWCIGLSWHTSFVGVPGYSWYCPPGSGATCGTHVLWMVSYYVQDFHMHGKMFISVYRLGEDGDLL